MNALIDIRDVDRRFYEDRLRDFLPGTIYDIHTHAWLTRFKGGGSSGPTRTVSWPARVAAEQTVEDLVETYRLMLPGKKVIPLMFGSVLDPSDDEEGGNAYVAREAARTGFPALLFAKPQWTADVLEEKVRRGGFLGIKVYLSLSDAYLPEKEIRIYDFLPPHQLEAANRNRWIVMLHIPRDGRLRDPVNLAQMLEMEDRFPRVKLIIAHVGRAYCPEDIGDAFKILRGSRSLMFDISANTQERVFRELVETVGPKRILFGSDLPITRMRMRRICEDGVYVNLVPRGLYGDVSGDRHMREVGGREAEGLTFFLYEEIDAFRRAAEATGLTTADIGDIFCRNAERLIQDASRPAVSRRQRILPAGRRGRPAEKPLPRDDRRRISRERG